MEVNKENAHIVGRAIYNEKIRDLLGPEYKGKIVVIDIYSGDYEIANNHSTAQLRLRERRPDAFTWAERVGYPAVYSKLPHPSIISKIIKFD